MALGMGNWASGIFPEWEACFAPWRPRFDFKQCRLCSVATFFDTFFIAPLIVGCREISAVVKDSAEAHPVTVEGICSRPPKNTELTHCIYVPQQEEYCSCPIETGDIGRQREAEGFRNPVSEFLGADICLHSLDLQNVSSLMLLCSSYHLWGVAMAQLRE